MHILICPNAFKHSLGAGDVALAISRGLQQSALTCTTECFPIGDGGDGTDDLVIANREGEIVEVTVSDPLGRRIKATYGMIDGQQTAVIGMAKASGINLLQEQELDPLLANSYGTGQQLVHALNSGVKNIVICMGGSATVDGATGILRALGFRFLDKNEKEIVALPRDLEQLVRIDAGNLDERIFDCAIKVLCDVDNPLLSDQGAAPVFGPQKGAGADTVKQLERCLSQFSDVILRQTGKDIAALKHGGTAGGAAAGLYALLNAELVNGIDYFLTLTNFSNALASAQVIITGEGSIDEQTLQGKGPFGVAQAAKQKGIAVIALAGKVPVKKHGGLDKYFDVLLPIGNAPTNLETALSNATENLVRTSWEVGNLLALSTGLNKNSWNR